MELGSREKICNVHKKFVILFPLATTRNYTQAHRLNDILLRYVLTNTG